MTEIKLVPIELSNIIPIFDGDKRHLNLFLRKCEYIYDKFKSTDLQNEYLMHLITSRLTGNAAALISERDDIKSFEEFKDLFILHYGDPRTEECLAVELETLKIRNNEHHTDFVARIRALLSSLLSKVNQNHSDQEERLSKMAIYNHTALQVFLYNLPENIVNVVRLKNPKTLDDALQIVLAEIAFYEHYKRHGNVGVHQQQVPRFGFPFGNAPTQNYGGSLFGSPNVARPASVSAPQAPAFGRPAVASPFGTFGSSTTTFGASKPPTSSFGLGSTQSTQGSAVNLAFGSPASAFGSKEVKAIENVNKTDNGSGSKENV